MSSSEEWISHPLRSERTSSQFQDTSRLALSRQPVSAGETAIRQLADRRYSAVGLKNAYRSVLLEANSRNCHLAAIRP